MSRSEEAHLGIFNDTTKVSINVMFTVSTEGTENQQEPHCKQPH